METIYKTFDGKTFKDKDDALLYEEKFHQGVKMWNRDGEVVYSTRDAFVVHLMDEKACSAFFALSRAEGDYEVNGIEEGEDYGLFLWDDCIDTYNYIGKYELTSLMVAYKYLVSIGKMEG